MGYFSHPGHLSFSNLTNEPERVHTTYNDRLLLIESTPAIQSVSCWPIWTVNTTQNQATRALTANSTLYGILNILCMRDMEIYNFPCAVNGKKKPFFGSSNQKGMSKKKNQCGDFRILPSHCVPIDMSLPLFTIWITHFRVWKTGALPFMRHAWLWHTCAGKGNI